MDKNKKKQDSRARRHHRVRAKVFGTAQRPRLCVSRSLKNIYLQLIDDENGVTIAAQSDEKIKGTKTERANEASSLIAKKAKEAGISEAVFDRGPFIFHGRIKAVAEGAKKEGLKF